MKKDDQAALLQRFAQGKEGHLQDYFGAHPESRDGREGYVFRVWAPNAREVCLMGEFNGWNETDHPMTALEGGVWELFVPGLERYASYKYMVRGKSGEDRAKADPFAFHAETRPGNASKLFDLEGYQWGAPSGLLAAHRGG